MGMYLRTIIVDGFVNREQWNDFIPSADGTVTVSTTVKAGVQLNDKIRE